MSPEQNLEQKAQELESMSRRRFFRNMGKMAARVVGLTVASAGAVDLARRPEAIVDIALNAKEKSPHASRAEIKKEIHGALYDQTGRTIIDMGLIAGGLYGVTHSGALESKEKTKNAQQVQPQAGK